MRWPDLLVLGAAKAGTTSLHQYLSEHPEIFMSRVKEPGYFAFAGDVLDFTGPGDDWMKSMVTTQRSDYGALFEHARDDQLTGESSPVYLYDEGAPRRMAEHIPGARLLVVLRNPIDRAFSHFRFMIACGREPNWSFPEALEAEEERLSNGWEWGWAYRRLGFYHRQLSRYLERFDRSQLHIVLFDDLEVDPSGVMKGMFEFLGVDPEFLPDMTRRLNVTSVTRSRRISQFLRSTGLRRVVHGLTTENQRQALAASSVMSGQVLTKDDIDDKSVAILQDAYEQDVSELQTLLGRDLRGWLEPGGRAGRRTYLDAG